jgi:hypothetical protein
MQRVSDDRLTTEVSGFLIDMFFSPALERWRWALVGWPIKRN